jgi:hypothetical protein
MAVELDPEEVLWVLNHQLGRPVPILDEMLAALKLNLWPALDAAGFNREACEPRSYHYAGEADIGKFGWPAIVVGGAFNTTEFGMGHIDEDEIHVTCAFPPQISRGQLQNSLDVVGVVRAIFYHSAYRSNHRDPDDLTRLIWNEMHPVGFRIVPGDFPFYGGWMASFIVRQPPQSNLWGTGIAD